jgi:hypothetical protein
MDKMEKQILDQLKEINQRLIEVEKTVTDPSKGSKLNVATTLCTVLDMVNKVNANLVELNKNLTEN